MLNGYDISDNQGDIDNRLVPGDFVGIKATEGIGYTDPDCDANYQQAKAAGKRRLVYHFARPDGNPNGADEARWFASQIRGYVGDAVLALDLETAPMTPAWAKDFLDELYNLTGVRGWLYGSASMFNTGDWSALWHDYAAWPASYGLNTPQNGYSVPSPAVSINGDWIIAAWQYTSRGRLPGWGGFLDLDVFYGDGVAWDKYAAVQGQTVVPTPPAPTPAPVVQLTPAPVTPVVTPPVVEPTVVPPVAPVLPPVVEPAPVVAVPVEKTPLQKSLLEALRLVVLAVPGFLIWMLTNNPGLALGYGGPILVTLKAVDEYIHKNPNTNLNGLLPF